MTAAMTGPADRYTAPDDPRPYRSGVGIVLVDADGRVFAARRRDTPDAWQMPQGGIDAGEDPLAAAKRELREETGVTSATLAAELPDTVRYDLPADISRRIWKGRYRGQEQRWYLFRFTGDDREIDIETHAPEFDAWRWMPAAELERRIVGFKRAVYRRVFEAFAGHLAGGSGR